MKKYHSDSQLLNTFQEARFGLDQIVRDINDSGFPPRVAIQATNSPPVPFQRYAVAPFAWGPLGTYPNSPCAIGTTCSLTPSSYDMIIETDIDPDNHQGTVEWVRYQLNGTTLYRGVVPKSSNPGADPEAITSGVFGAVRAKRREQSSRGTTSYTASAISVDVPQRSGPGFSYDVNSLPNVSRSPTCRGRKR